MPPAFPLSGWRADRFRPHFRLILLSLLLTVWAVVPLSAEVRINEIMSSNGTTIADEDGDFEDWIELVNTGHAAVDLSGWGLSDSENNPFKWTFPSGTFIDPGDFLLVWASGKDRYLPPFKTLPVEFLDSLQLWLKPEGLESVLVEESEFVANWVNSVDDSVVASQPNANRRPRINRDVIKGMPIARFDGVDDFLSGTFPAAFNDQDLTVLVVARLTTTDGRWQQVITFGAPSANAASSSGVPHFGRRSITSQFGYHNTWAGNTGVFVETGGSFQDWFIGGLRIEGDLVGIFFNTDQSEGFRNWPVQSSAGFQIGIQSALSGSTNSWTGDIAEILVFDRALDPQEISLVRHYLRSRYFDRSPIIHTSYSIRADGEPITLTRPDSSQADFVPATAIPRGISYGRVPDGTGAWSFFAEPTPRYSNSTVAYAGILDPPTFSHPGGFHPEAINLALTHLDPEAVIYYTLDGSEPDPLNLDGQTYQYKNSYPLAPGDPFGEFLVNDFRSHLYVGAITIENRGMEPDKLTRISSTYDFDPAYFPSSPVRKGTVVRARAVRSGMLPGVSGANTYFIGPNPYSLPVLSFSIQEDSLFDFYTGIYVAGQGFDLWRQSNPLPIASGPVGNYRNRGDAWERPAGVELFTPDHSTAVLRQDVGVRIHGNWSRRSPAKNLRLYARSQYDPQGAMTTTVFKDQVPFASLPDNQQFDRLVLRRRGAQQGALQDIVANNLLLPSFAGMTRSEAAVMFFNGEYWGVTYLRDRFDQHHLANHYDLDPDDVVITYSGGFLPRASYRHAIDVGRPSDILLFQELEDAILNHDLADEANYAVVANMLDIQGYIDKIVSVAFLCNNHYEHGYWRVREPVDAHFGDGKWRSYVKDFDMIPVRYFGAPSGPEGLEYVRMMADSIPIFKALLASESFEREFINRFSDHLNTIFTTARFVRIVSEAQETLSPYLSEDFHRWGYSLNLASMPGRLKVHAELHPQVQRQHLRDHFGLGLDANLTLDVSDANGGQVNVNTIAITSKTPGVDTPVYPWTGIYFRGIPVTIAAIPEPGYRFAGWLELPDEEFAEIEVTLTGDTNFTAIFDEAEPEPEAFVIHGWDFEALEVSMPSQTFGGGALSAELEDGAEWLRNTGGQDFDTAHLRVNNPLGATLAFTLPTTGFGNIGLGFDTRRSGQGAGIQTLSYTVNGSDWIEHVTYPVSDAAPQVQFFDFGAIGAVSDNPDFAVRITFSQGSGGTFGNNRFDSVRLTGTPLPRLNLPPVLVAAPGRQVAVAAGAALLVDLSGVFSDPDGDVLIYGVALHPPDLAAAAVDGGLLTIQGHQAGNVRVEVSASDGINPPVATGFDLLVYPAAHRVADADYLFREWSASSPAGSFPAHMVFLQGEGNSDAELATPLTRAYEIPEDDAAEAADVALPYAALSRTRIDGLGEGGIAFINSGRERDLGSALLALDTRDVDVVQVAWVAGTVLPNSRVYGLRLQARVGAEGEFSDVMFGGQPAEYVRNDSAGHRQVFGPLVLPEALMGHALVQLQWKYHHLAELEGPRAQLSLDDIVITAGAPRSYEAWRLTEYPGLAERAEDGISGPGAAAGAHPNLLRYALGAGKGGDLSGLLPHAAGGPGFALRFPFDPAKADIRYRVLRYLDLTELHPEAIFDSTTDPLEALPFADGWLEVPDADQPLLQRAFYRLEITEQ